VKFPKGAKIIGYKWIFKKKEGIPSIENARFKAHLVAKGYSQREGMDFNEVFSPIVRHSYIRVLLAMVALYDLVSLRKLFTCINQRGSLLKVKKIMFVS
jgi:hypothetical protein